MGSETSLDYLSHLSEHDTNKFIPYLLNQPKDQLLVNLIFGPPVSKNIKLENWSIKLYNGLEVIEDRPDISIIGKLNDTEAEDAILDGDITNYYALIISSRILTSTTFFCPEVFPSISLQDKNRRKGWEAYIFLSYNNIYGVGIENLNFTNSFSQRVRNILKD